MRVLVIPSWYPIGEDKLMGIYHKEYTNAINKNGVDADILYVYRCGLKHPFKYLLEKRIVHEEEDGYDVYRIKMLNLEPISYKLHMKIYAKKLEKLYKYYLKKNTKPDILHAEVTLPAGYATCLLGKKYDIPVLVTEHSSNFLQYFEGKNKEYGEYVINNAHYSTVSNLMKKQCKGFIKNVDIIPNVVDTDAFHLIKRRGRGRKKINLVCVTAFRIGKGVETLLNAMYVLVNKKDIKDIRLNIVGDGYMMDYYKGICSKLGLDDYVVFHGRKDKIELTKILIENDIFVVCSDYESFCIPGVEALASGMPVVSTRCAGPEEYLDKDCGEFCRVKDPEDMANKIMLVYKKLNTYDKNYLRSVADKYSYKSVSKIALNVYNKLIKKID